MRIPWSPKAFAGFLRARSARERMILMAAGSLLIFTIDYFFLFQPVIGALSRSIPEAAWQKRDWKELKEDDRDRALIHARWQEAGRTLAEKEKVFSDFNEVSALLENLSKLAVQSGVRITSLKPMEPAPGAASARYRPALIRIDGLAGTHELGAFLAALEGGETFFGVKDMKITANAADSRRHLFELDIQAYRKAE